MIYRDVVSASQLHVTSVAMVISAGNLYHHGHLCRAVCCRLEHEDKLPELPPGFRLNHPKVGKVGGTTLNHPRIGKVGGTTLKHSKVGKGGGTTLNDPRIGKVGGTTHPLVGE